MSSNIPSEKKQVVQKTVELIKQYQIIAAADLTKVSSTMLQDMIWYCLINSTVF